MLVKVRSHESVRFSSYVSFCNVLYICNIRVIPTYRVYRLYDMAVSIGGTRFVRCTEVVRSSESPLLEVSLYVCRLLTTSLRGLVGFSSLSSL